MLKKRSLAGIPLESRGIVITTAMKRFRREHRFLSNLPIILTVVGMLLGVFLSLIVVDAIIVSRPPDESYATYSNRLWVIYGISLSSAFGFGALGNLIRARRLAPYYKAVIDRLPDSIKNT